MGELSSGNSAPIERDSATQREMKFPARIIVSLRAGVVLAVANVVCVAVLSWAWVHSRAEPRVISVTGSAKKVIDSDLIVWTGHISASDPKLELAYTVLKASTDKTVDFLKSAGVTPSQITVGSIETVRHLQRDAKGNETDLVASYELKQPVWVSSNDLDKVSAAAFTVTDLLKLGVQLESEPPKFFYTKMSDLKINMLADATKDATSRAQQIASNSGSRLGSIRDARMGVMQINAIHSDQVSDSGVNDTSSRQKEITAVLSARFELE